MTLLASLVEASGRVGATSARLEKVRELAAFLRSLEPPEIRIGVQYLSGEAPQGRIGIGPAVLREASATEPAEASSLTLTEVDRTITRGRGAARARASARCAPRRLRDLFGRATGSEQRFLARLMLGELRQGALEGVMVDAIAPAAEVPVADVRRAMMYARRRRRGREAALAREERRPREVPARDPFADRADACADGGESGRCPAAARRRGRIRMEAGWRAHPGAQVRRRRAHLYAQPERSRCRHPGDRGAGRQPAGAGPDP